MLATDNIGAIALFATTVVASLHGIYRSDAFVQRCLFRPYYFLRRPEYETMFTSGFVHADMGHLLFNMITFWFFAFPLERMLGTFWFLVLYALGLVLSHLCTWQKHKNNPHYASLGASGAISAVLFTYVLYAPFDSLLIFPIPVPIPAWMFAIGYLAYSFYAARNPRGRINHDAHFCGALAGIVFVFITDAGAIPAFFQALGSG